MISYPLKLGSIVHYRPKGASELHVLAGIITKLPNGQRECWLREGQTADLSLFVEDGSRSVANVTLSEGLDEGTFSPADVTVSRHEERT